MMVGPSLMFVRGGVGDEVGKVLEHPQRLVERRPSVLAAGKDKLVRQCTSFVCASGTMLLLNKSTSMAPCDWPTAKPLAKLIFLLFF